MTRESSAMAHQAVEDEGTANALRKLICRAVLHAPGTARELAARIHADLQSVTPRCAELKRMGVLQEVGQSTNPGTGKKAVQWGPTLWTDAYVKGAYEPVVERAPAKAPRAVAERVLAASLALYKRPGSLQALDEFNSALRALESSGYGA